MKYVKRALEELIKKQLKPNKVVVLLGARRVGKTELVKHVLAELQENTMLLNGEDQDVHLALAERSIRNYKRFLSNTSLLVIDEAQAIPDIGQKLKLMVDSVDDIKILVTGSSVFDLGNQLGEPLVGRAITLKLYPLAQMELASTENFLETKSNFDDRLIYGSYPELEHLDNLTDKADYLKEQVNSYLLKDILAFEGVRKSDKLVPLSRMICLLYTSDAADALTRTFLGSSLV